MNPPRSLFATLVHLPMLRNNWLRRGLLALALAVCALFTLYPQQYRAAISLTPSDPSTLGLGGTLGQLGAVSSVFGNQAAVEVTLRVAHSEKVREMVSRKANLEKRLAMSETDVHRWLDRNVDLSFLSGGIIQFEVKNRDPVLAKDVVAAYGEEVRSELAIISRRQTAYKRDILVNLVNDASDRLAKAQGAYDSFRLKTKYITPGATLYAVGERVPALEDAIRSKKLELATERKFATDDNIKIQRILAQISVLQQQLAEAKSTSRADTATIGEAVHGTTEAERLQRDLDLAQTLYNNYKRYLLGTSVEDLTSEANIRILEPAYIDSARQFNYIPLSIGVIIILLGIAIEFYLVRLPVTDRPAE